jgi:hypothetical protein
MIKTIFLVIVMFSFIVIVIGTNNIAYAQFDKSRERQEENTAVVVEEEEEVNLTDERKFLCLQIDAKNGIDQIEDKEQQKQCEEFLDKVSIYEIRELIDKYLGVKDN